MESCPAPKEQSRKRGAIGASGTGGIEMILTLLAEVVALLVRLSEKKVRKPGF